MTEPIFSLYLFLDAGDTIRELGVYRHDRGGSDADRSRFLQSMAGADLRRCVRRPVPARFVTADADGRLVPGGFGYESYLVLWAAGRALEMFEDVLEEFGAGREPLVCMTPVRDGQIRMDGQIPVGGPGA